MGIVGGSCGYRTRGVSIRGKCVLSKKPRALDEGRRNMAKRRSDPRVTYPEVKLFKIVVCFLWLSLPADCRVTDEALLAETT